MFRLKATLFLLVLPFSALAYTTFAEDGGLYIRDDGLDARDLDFDLEARDALLDLYARSPRGHHAPKASHPKKAPKHKGKGKPKTHSHAHAPPPSSGGGGGGGGDQSGGGQSSGSGDRASHIMSDISQGIGVGEQLIGGLGQAAGGLLGGILRREALAEALAEAEAEAEAEADAWYFDDSEGFY